MSQTNCLAPSTATSFKIGQAVSNLFLQPTSTLTPTSSSSSSSSLTSTTVAITTSDPYSSYADNFDLSLLPQDCASPTENIPTTVFQYKETTSSSTPTSASLSATSTLQTTPEIKIEQTWPCTAEEIKQEPANSFTHYEQLNCHQLQQKPQQLHLQQPQQFQTKSPHLLIPPPPYPHAYPSPQSSPAQSEYAFPNTQFAGCYDSLSSSRSSLYPSSPCPSIDASSIKQELHILPPSPPESSCETPSPRSSCTDIKIEPIDADVEALIDLNKLLKKSFELTASPATEAEAAQTPQQDHQLLREYLEDTTFQKKHNLKPLALESFIGGLEEVRGDFEPVISLALEHAKREADETCAKLQISQDPSAWSPQQVHAWLRSTIMQFKLPLIDNLESKFCEDGTALILLSEEEFIRRVPESGCTLHAQLEIWKLAFSDGYQNNHQTIACDAVQMQQNMWHTCGLQDVKMDVEHESEDEEGMLPSTSNAVVVMPETQLGNSNTTAATVAAVATVEPKRTGATGRNGGSHIHLWQFLKELLAAPQINGTAIRWIDRNKGIFKIEDSVRVAKLWGRRKNRPAMNYDKLSRSIRQYYKKGIMKKTERSQRLVYQFCHPYHM